MHASVYVCAREGRSLGLLIIACVIFYRIVFFVTFRIDFEKCRMFTATEKIASAMNILLSKLFETDKYKNNRYV